MSNVQLVNRLISNVCEIPSEKIKSGQLADYEWQQLDYKLRDLLDAPLYVDDTPSLSVFELRTKARRLVREHGSKDYHHRLPSADECKAECLSVAVRKKLVPFRVH